ncbi:MAG TPA: hypothetical protein VHF25_13105 [Nitriliruptorales bacterium]|nr:hypothetical protein [Nitriliruptorales bacterium]
MAIAPLPAPGKAEHLADVMAAVQATVPGAIRFPAVPQPFHAVDPSGSATR